MSVGPLGCRAAHWRDRNDTVISRRNPFKEVSTGRIGCGRLQWTGQGRKIARTVASVERYRRSSDPRLGASLGTVAIVVEINRVTNARQRHETKINVIADFAIRERETERE